MKIPFLLLASALFYACDQYPQDPHGTLDEIRDANLYVGLIHNPPFVEFSDGDTTGVEVELIMKFAAEKNARIIWVTGSTGVLMEKLKHHELHMIIGGLKQHTPYNETSGITRPYFRDFVMAVPQGENAFLIALEKFLKEQQMLINKELLQYDG